MENFLSVSKTTVLYKKANPTRENNCWKRGLLEYNGVFPVAFRGLFFVDKKKQLEIAVVGRGVTGI